MLLFLSALGLSHGESSVDAVSLTHGMTMTESITFPAKFISTSHVLRNFYDRFEKPPVHAVPVNIKVGKNLFTFQQENYHVSFLPFLKNVPAELHMERELIETNRCFFLHLGVLMDIHPFALEIALRVLVHKFVDCLTAETSWVSEVVDPITQYTGLVDANALCFIWPKEFNNTRICVVSGPLSAPIFSCFVPPNCTSTETLNDVILRCDGSHFTILRPPKARGKTKILTLLMSEAQKSGLLVQVNQAEPYSASNPQQSILDTVQAILDYNK